MQYKFYKLNTSELKFLEDNCNFTEDEKILLMMASRRCSDIQIADKLGVATSTVTKRKKQLSSKINDFLEVIGTLTTIYINGKPITIDEMENYKLCVEEISGNITAKLTKK
jgi:hypothetical protein